MTNADSAHRADQARVAFETFYRKHFNAVLRFAERRIDHETAADVCTECFAIAWRKFDPERPFGITWLYRTTHHLLGNKYRKRAREDRMVERLHYETLLDQEVEIDDGAQLLLALERLSDADQEVLRLTYWDGLGAADAAEVLRTSEQAIWKRTSRAKAKLRIVLSEMSAEDNDGRRVSRG